MNRPLIALALATLAPLTPGCTSPPPEDTSRPEDRFDITRPGSAWLDGQLVAVTLNTPRQDEPLSWFEATLENRGAAPLALEIRTLWKDSNDQQVGEGPWTPLDLAPGERKVVEGENDIPATRYLKLEVRPRQ